MNEQLRSSSARGVTRSVVQLVAEGLTGLPAMRKLTGPQRRTVIALIAARVGDSDPDSPLSLDEARKLLNGAVSSARRRRPKVGGINRSSSAEVLRQQPGGVYGVKGVTGLPDGTYVRKGSAAGFRTRVPGRKTKRFF